MADKANKKTRKSAVDTDGDFPHQNTQKFSVILGSKLLLYIERLTGEEGNNGTLSKIMKLTTENDR